MLLPPTFEEEKNLHLFGLLFCLFQLMFPLHFTGLLNKVDIVAEVEGGGFTGQSSAIRYAMSKALASFVGKEVAEEMRVGKLDASSETFG